MELNVKNKCFVISPIGEKGSVNYDKFNEVLEYIIKPAIEDSIYELEVLRADEIKRPGSWMNDILLNIYNSFIVIADLTDKNPNVFYELGVRHALSPRTILIAQSIDDVPSDLKSYRTIIYEMSLRGPNKFKNDLGVYLNEIHNDPNRPDNPVLDKLSDLQNNKIYKLEIENNKLNDEIKILKSLESSEKDLGRNFKESAFIRVDRIFDVKKIKSELTGYSIKENGSWVGFLPSNQGEFRLYTYNEEGQDPQFIYLCSNPRLNINRELADIRVLMSETDSGQKIKFIIVSDEDLSEIRSDIYSKFTKMKEYINESSREFFSLEIWDDDILLELEKELGLIIEN